MKDDSSEDSQLSQTSSFKIRKLAQHEEVVQTVSKLREQAKEQPQHKKQSTQSLATKSAIGIQTVQQDKHKEEINKLYISKEKQRIAAERAEAEVKRQWTVTRQL